MQLSKYGEVQKNLYCSNIIQELLLIKYQLCVPISEHKAEY